MKTIKDRADRRRSGSEPEATDGSPERWMEYRTGGIARRMIKAAKRETASRGRESQENDEGNVRKERGETTGSA